MLIAIRSTGNTPPRPEPMKMTSKLQLGRRLPANAPPRPEPMNMTSKLRLGRRLTANTTPRPRANEYEETAIRQETNRQRTAQARANEDVEQSSDRLQTERQRCFQSRARKKNDTKAALDGQALHYNISNFLLLTSVGNMDVTCPHCRCLKFKGETPGMCCSAGKNILPNFPGHPTYLQGLYDGVDANSKHFLANIRNYNCAFQMTSFGCQEQQMPGWNPSFRVQGQVCHKIGSLLPPPYENAKFLQVYFIDEQYETATRMQIAPGLKQPIVKQLSALFHEGNNYIRYIKTAMENLQQEETTNARVVIHEEMRPAGEHERRFNAQTTSAEIGILMPNEPNAIQDIVLRLRDGQLTRINELHRGYDPLQYPLLFPHGTDGYSIYLKMSNGKKVSMTQFYQFHIMTRTGNELIKGRRLYQQFLVDMYCKIETERLQFLAENKVACELTATKIYGTPSLLQVEMQTMSVNASFCRPHSTEDHDTCMRDRWMPCRMCKSTDAQTSSSR